MMGSTADIARTLRRSPPADAEVLRVLLEQLGIEASGGERRVHRRGGRWRQPLPTGEGGMSELKLIGVEELQAAELRQVDGGTESRYWDDPENPNGGCIPDPIGDAIRKLYP